MSGTTILVVDDEPQIRRMLRRILEPRGYLCLEAGGVNEAVEVLDRETIELVLSDINMQDGSGLDLILEIQPRIPDVSVIMVTSTDDASVAVKALERGAYGYVMKPFQINEIIIQVENALRRRELEIEHRNQEAVLTHRVRKATDALRRTQEEVALRLIAASEYRDNETGSHIRRLGLYAAEMAKELGWSVSRVEQIRAAAPMHDIGKIGIPDAILQKPESLTPDEWKVMQTHAEIGQRILSGTDIPLLDMAAQIAGGHHERWNGGGYPSGLKGELIPLSARIVAVADVYDALTHARCYKPAWPEDKATELIQARAGEHFDPDLVVLFMDNLSVMREIRIGTPDENPLL